VSPFDWVVSLVATLAIEVPLVVALGGRRLLAPAILATSITHPLVWLVFPPGALVAGELFAVATEAGFYRAALPFRRALAVSALANAASLAGCELLGRLSAP
jgi:hypothetical protein